ncbi:formimidoylglutamate deiminase [uncultured Sneathiella sp.]|uniref:formimidoylglutamate deiminase n=1 Tax=uncultured Sneathiella sp. TaxID=879315 RepID=UPI00259A74DD|nr:formimidoylglutamate deiminase [uncultured Sneathiella sp.]
MIKHFFDELLLSNGWRRNQFLDISESGEILAIGDGTAKEAEVIHRGYAVPGIANVHSHAFQRAMAGLAEAAGQAADSFWSWRQVMYGFLRTITPEQLEIIASQLYLEMLKAGFTSVGEFHYLHHDRDGTAYADPTEMSGRIIAAAERTGIGLTLLPVLYRYSGFGGQDPQDHQRRFIMEGDEFLTLMQRLQNRSQGNDSTLVGVAPHSLRAVDPALLKMLLAGIPKNMPCHIHIAEQQKEVADCLDWSGARPVEWLADNMPLDDRWCLIHATHITETERRGIAQSGAVAGLCPITEANLGDGIFPAGEFLDDGGRFALGSDSNIYISLAEEIRLLEYGQRLTREQRNVLGDESRSTGTRIFSAALSGGHQALGRPGKEGLQVGGYANFVLLDGDHPALLGKPARKILDSWLFAGDNSVVKDVAVNGKLVIKDRHHAEEEAITHRFRRVITELAAGH